MLVFFIRIVFCVESLFLFDLVLMKSQCDECGVCVYVVCESARVLVCLIYWGMENSGIIPRNVLL